MNPVRIIRAAVGMTQSELAAAAGTSQPAIAAYEGGTKSPTMRTLQRLATAAGLDLELAVHRAMTREERRSLAVHAAIIERLCNDPDGIVRSARATLRRMRALHPNAGALLDEWALLLDRPLPRLIAQLADPSEHARELRHVTPFAGVLSARERTTVYRAFAAAERSARAQHSGAA